VGQSFQAPFPCLTVVSLRPSVRRPLPTALGSREVLMSGFKASQPLEVFLLFFNVSTNGYLRGTHFRCQFSQEKISHLPAALASAGPRLKRHTAAGRCSGAGKEPGVSVSVVPYGCNQVFTVNLIAVFKVIAVEEKCALSQRATL